MILVKKLGGGDMGSVAGSRAEKTGMFVCSFIDQNRPRYPHVPEQT